MTSEPVGVDALPQIGPAVVVMGVFDGLHLGHRSMLEAACAAGHERGASSVALVFDPHPEEVLRPGIAVPYLAPLAANLTRIEGLGIDYAIAVRFDTALRSLTAEAFLAALGTALDLRGLVMSPESAFGRDRRGTVARMREVGAAQGFEVIIVQPTMLDGEVVSSSRVRDAIARGDLAGARRLGAPAGLEAEVRTSAADRRQARLPLAFDYLPVLPPVGRYAVRVTRAGVGGQLLPGVVEVLVPASERSATNVSLRVIGSEAGMRPGPVSVELVARLADPQAGGGSATADGQFRLEDAEAVEALHPS